jgi:hypothetical protein
MLKDFRLRRASLWPLLRRALGGLGLGLTVSALPAVAHAQPPVQDHWVRYAQFVSNTFQHRLNDPGQESVRRLHGWLQERMHDSSKPLPAPVLVVRVRVGAAGQIDGLEFDSLGWPQADADLSYLLTSEPLPVLPPRDLRQPIVLQLTLGLPS